MSSKPLDMCAQKEISTALEDLRTYLNADVFAYCGDLMDGVEEEVRKNVEHLKETNPNNQKLYVLLTTNGGSLNPVNRIVNIFRHHYHEVYFIIPDY
ncbi:MAG: hypothetical protein LBB56_04535, partial [Chitinispirillales bacterium]|nr:hypothetical protein [Chitinispirillales bacterium]